jgi:hypothetical protein
MPPVDRVGVVEETAEALLLALLGQLADQVALGRALHAVVVACLRVEEAEAVVMPCCQVDVRMPASRARSVM